MNPNSPDPIEPSTESRLTALILGQLPPDQAAELESQIANDSTLAQSHARLNRAAQLLRETIHPHSATSESASNAPAPLQLSPERREKLLATLRSQSARSTSTPTSASLESTTTTTPTASVVPLNAPTTHRRRFQQWRDVMAVAAMLIGLAIAAQMLYFDRRNASGDRAEAKPRSYSLRTDNAPAGPSAGIPLKELSQRIDSLELGRKSEDDAKLPVGGSAGVESYFSKEDEKLQKRPEILAEAVVEQRLRTLSSSGGDKTTSAGPSVKGKVDSNPTPLAVTIPPSQPVALDSVKLGTLADQPLEERPLVEAKEQLSRNQVQRFSRGSVVDVELAPPAPPKAHLDSFNESLAQTTQLGSSLRGLREANGRYTNGVAFFAMKPLEDRFRSQMDFGENSLSTANGTVRGEVNLAEKRPELFGIQAERWEFKSSKPVSELRLGYAAGFGGAKAAKPLTLIHQTEIVASDKPLSTFSLNVSDVSFKLTAASLDQGVLPQPATLRSEEFINAFHFPVPEPPKGTPIAFQWEHARSPFEQNRDLLRLSVKVAASGRQTGRPLNLVLLVDNSGSMERADRVRIREECIRVLSTQLKAGDRISVIGFARNARLWIDGLPGERAQEVVQRVSALTPEGGTNLEEALQLAYQTASKHRSTQSVNRVVLMTDGAANLGDVSIDTLNHKVESERNRGIALDCFGIGWDGLEDAFLEQLSRHGDGRYGFINSPEAASTEFAGQLAGSLKVAASDVKAQIEFNPRRVTLYRQIGYAQHQLTAEQFRDNTVDAAELAAAESGTALYTVQTNPSGDGAIGVLRVRFKVPGTSDYQEHSWTIPYAGPAKPLQQSSQAFRLAATAATFSDWLGANPYAASIQTSQLLREIESIPEQTPSDSRPGMLRTMILNAQRLTGK